MHIVTEYVFPDEPCHGLAEGPQIMPRPGGKGTWLRWVQWVFVIRDDAIAKFVWDIGPVEAYESRCSPLRMPSFGENTVAELQAHAERNRHNDKYIRRRDELAAESTLVEDVLAQMEVRYHTKSNRSVIGPFRRVQRNGWSEHAATQVLKDRVKERINGRR